jgi:hypothetical protein
MEMCWVVEKEKRVMSSEAGQGGRQGEDGFSCCWLSRQDDREVFWRIQSVSWRQMVMGVLPSQVSVKSDIICRVSRDDILRQYLEIPCSRFRNIPFFLIVLHNVVVQIFIF